jgi:hypothetical protein
VVGAEPPRRERSFPNLLPEASATIPASSASDLRARLGRLHMDKAELEIGFGDFEHLAASRFGFSATLEICRDDRICHQERMPNSGRERIP